MIYKLDIFNVYNMMSLDIYTYSYKTIITIKVRALNMSSTLLTNY